MFNNPLRITSLHTPTMNRLLTPLELKVMKILWRQKSAFVKDLLDSWDEEPKPAYNTVSTIVRILEEKNFVGHKAYGRTHEYYPEVSENDYQRDFMHSALANVFSGSMTSLVSTLVDSEKISSDELDKIKRLIMEKA